MPDDHEFARVQDDELNKAILSKDISFDFLPFVELCHNHYADEVDVSFDKSPRSTIARDKLEGMLLDFLFPLHVISEIGGVEVRVGVQPITSDTPDQQHSAWSVELLAKNGARHAMFWKTMRTWIAGKVVAEHLYDQYHEGPSLQHSDLEWKLFDANYFPDHL